jgi:8-oxo-dGTP pyrophosphatase MutT (NUDIX family)
VEPGETVEEALVREVREELGIALPAYRFFRKYAVRGGEEATPNDKYIFHAEITQAQEALRLYEGERLQYFRPEETRTLPFANILGGWCGTFWETYDPAQAPTMRPLRIHHVAVIASDYGRSRDFYTRVLGCELVGETYRAARQSWKGDLSVGDCTRLSCFRFRGPRRGLRIRRRRACGIWPWR